MSAAHASIISLKLTELDLSQTQLSAYCGVNVNKISPWLAGTRDIDNVSLLRIDDTLRSLATLSKIAKPWPLDFRKVAEIKALLQRLHDGEFDTALATAAQTNEMVAA